jgi:hypothetical protein
MTGADDDTNGQSTNPFYSGATTENMRRNAYSTKLISVRSVAQGQDNYYSPASGNNAKLFSEMVAPVLRNNSFQFKNPIENVDLSVIFY